MERMSPTTLPRGVETATFVLWALLTAWLTLTPAASASPTVRPFCLLCGEVGGADLLRNVLLFAPAGLLLARRGVSVLAALGIGLALSTSIEIVQMLVPGRYPTFRDIITNGLGAGAGAVFHHSIAYGVRSASRVLLGAASAFAVATVAVTGWLLQPDFTDGVYFAQWVPVRPYYAPWNGRVVSADIDGLPMRIGRLDDTDAVRTALQDSRPLHLRFVQGDPPPALAAIFAIMDDSRREILAIGVDGDDLVLRPRIRATTARMDLTDQRLVGFMARHAPGDTINLAITTDGHGRSCVQTATETTCARAASLGAAWQITLWKGAWPESAKRVMHGLTVLLLFVPLALLSAAQPRRTAGIVFGATFVGCVMVGRAFGMAWPGVVEFLAAVLVLGYALRRRLLSVGRWD